jgi:hypothetical protein
MSPRLRKRQDRFPSGKVGRQAAVGEASRENHIAGIAGRLTQTNHFLLLSGILAARFQGTMEPKRGGGAYRTCACLNIDALVDGPWARIFHGPHPPEDAWNPTKHDCAKQYFQKPTWMTYSALRRIERRQGHPGKLGTICIKLDLGNNA